MKLEFKPEDFRAIDDCFGAHDECCLERDAARIANAVLQEMLKEAVELEVVRKSFSFNIPHSQPKDFMKWEGFKGRLVDIKEIGK